MSKLRTFTFNGLDLLISPYLQQEGDLIRSVNVNNFPIGAKTKRPGYQTFLANPDNQPVTALFDWHKSDGTTFWLYRVSNGVIYNSAQGTAPWSPCSNGTITPGATPGYAILDDVLILGDGTAATRHSTDGVTFTNTPAAPYAPWFEVYQGRVYAIGTASDIFYSCVSDATNWTSGGTADSSSIHVPGKGKLNSCFKIADRLIMTKNSGEGYRWDGYTLYDMATNLGPTSPYSIGKIEQHRFWINRQGIYGFDGDAFTLLSNPVGRLIFNDNNTGIAGTTFDTAPGVGNRWDYFVTVGSSTDDLTNEQITNLTLDYDFQHNEWTCYNTATLPTCWLAFDDNTRTRQTIFGDSSGQCYQWGGTALSDNGTPIQAVMEGVIHFGSPEADKKFNYIWAMTNPGCQAHIQVAIANTFTKQKLNWISLGDLSDGITEMRFPKDSDGKLMFWKLTENSMQDRFTFFGFVVDVDIQERQ